jgi:hypothetical protein
MGLLDDAIREHLELKRRAGADPSEIARTENEALAPVVPESDPTLPESDPAVPGTQPADRAAGLREADEQYAAPDGFADQVAAGAAGLEEVGEETAELDMQAVLDAEAEHQQGTVGAQEPVGGEEAARPVRARTSEANHEDSLEWEMPGAEDPTAPPPEIPGQEKLTFE